MKIKVLSLVWWLIIASMATPATVRGQADPALLDYYSNIEFQYEEISGIGHEVGVTRRDPSDILMVGDTYYVYYTKVYGRSPGYWGTVWYATSQDEGHNWTEQGELLGLGQLGVFDSQATFTPNVIHADGRYYLYYTGVKPTPGNPAGEFENNSTTDITAIGVAVSDSPGGPFQRVPNNPILKVSVEPEKFDSYRVDDAALLFRNGLYWLYYKGRSRLHGKDGPARTKMGVAYSKHPAGPFIKYGSPLMDQSHEVMIWPHSGTVVALASISSTFEFAKDGINFQVEESGLPVQNRPNAPGVYRPDLIAKAPEGEGLKWGISMIHHGDESYLIRFSVKGK